MDWGQEEKELGATTIKDLHLMIKQAFELKVKIDEIEALAEEQKTHLEKLKHKMSAVLGENNMTHFKSEYGAITRKAEYSVKIPKLEEQRNAFFEYLKKNGLFDQMITVNSRTLNSHVKEEREAALAKGIIDFSIPGIEPGVEIYRISMTKK